jgi:hypothetical protein
MLPVLFASLTYTAVNAQTSTDQTSILKQIELQPILNGFKFGQKDLYSGLSNEAKNLVIRISKEFPDEPMVRNDQSMTGDEYELYIASIRQVLINGATKLENDKGTVSFQIMELPENRHLFIKTDNKKVEQLNANKFLGYIRGFYAASGKKFHEVDFNKKKESETRYMLVKPNLRVETKPASEEIIEEIVEVVEVETVIKQVDENTNGSKIIDVPFAIIEKVPSYPGCSGTNAERKECMQEQITAHVLKNFNTKIAKEVGLSGKQYISVQFKIGPDGYVTGVKSRAKAPELEKEAVRVINMLPKMKPGMQRGKEVGVIYSLPIIFEAGETKKED